MKHYLFVVLFGVGIATAQAQTVTGTFQATIAGSGNTNPPSTPSGPGPLYYNPTVITNTLVPTATGLTHGMSNGSVRGLYYEFDDATSAQNTLATAFTSHQVELGPSAGDKVGGIFNVYNCCASASGWILGGDSTAAADVNSSQGVLAAHQFEVTTLGSAAALRRYGVVITVDPGSNTAGTQFDAAIAIDNMGNPGSEWHNILSVGDSEGTIGPVNQNSNIIHANGPATIANFCDCGNWTVGGYILNFVNFQVTGAGGVVANSYSYKGVPGANCPAGTFFPATAVVQGGIITNCGHP